MENLKVKRFYNYSEIDGQYIDYEDINQDYWTLKIEGKEYYANPAYSTEIKPLEPKEGFIVCFNEKENKWEYKEIEKEKENILNEKSKFTIEQLQIIEEYNELINYLHNTDWYVTRKLETGKEIPEEIKEQREEAREKISELVKENEFLKELK